MALWTVSWQAGSGGDVVARLLAERAEVPLVDGEFVADVVGAGVQAGGRVGRALSPWLSDLALSIAPVFGIAPATVVERGASPSLREATESVILDTARSCCVVADCSAFAILSDHPSACHVRIRAPLDWRTRRHALENCLSWEAARDAVLREERRRRLHVQRAYGRALESADNFTVVCDSSRFQLDDLAGVLLVAGRRGAELLA